MLVIVAAQDRHRRVDLVGRVALPAGVDAGAGADRERQSAEPADRAGELPAARRSSAHAVIQQVVSLAERQLVHVVELEGLRAIESGQLLVQADTTPGTRGTGCRRRCRRWRR